MIISLPEDIRDWLTHVFRSCNERISAKLSRIPTLHETSLDLTFIEHLSQFSAPFRFPANWLVRIDSHYLGGGRHFGEWEIADIGVLVIFRRAGKVVRSKVALLQSKRLYPDEQKFEEDRPIDYMVGFGRLFESDEQFAAVTEKRLFAFNEESRYKAIKVGDRQYKLIEEYELKYEIPVYYLLYQPWRIPFTAQLPVEGAEGPDGSCDVGCRVLPASQLHVAMTSKQEGDSPTYKELKSAFTDPFTGLHNQAGWPLESFVVELLLECHTGYIAKGREDEGLFRIFNRRTGPISAAISITIDAP